MAAVVSNEIYKCIILEQCVWYVHRFIKADTSSVGQPPSVVGGSIEYLMGLTYVYSVLCMWWWLKGPTTCSWPPNGKKFFLPPFLVWMMVIDFLHKSTKSICYEAF